MSNTALSGVDFTPSSTEKGLGRKWRYFQGKNHFYCNGRIITSPTIRYCFLTSTLIFVTFGLFIIYDVPFLTEKLSIAIPIVSSILFVIVVINMIRTSVSDPGILPRATIAETEALEKSYAYQGTNSRPPPRTRDVVVNGQTVKSKYCFTCKMFRPPRASHCSICDNCVERFDHHCPFLGNCVGKRNYRSFYFFVVSLSFLTVIVLSCSITHLALLSRQEGDFVKALKLTPVSVAVILISFFGMWTVIGLAGFHTYLIAVEQTTNEDIKGLFGNANVKNPYSRGNFIRNCCFILCGPAQSSLLDPRGYATPEYISQLSKANSTVIEHRHKRSCCRCKKKRNKRNEQGLVVTQDPESALHPQAPAPSQRPMTSNPQTQGNLPQNFQPKMNGRGPSATSQIYLNGGGKAGTYPGLQTQGQGILPESTTNPSSSVIMGPGTGTPSKMNRPKPIILDDDEDGNPGSVSMSMVQNDLIKKGSRSPPGVSSSSSGMNFELRNETLNKTGNGHDREGKGEVPDKATLEHTTMINSPLHLDSIV